MASQSSQADSEVTVHQATVVMSEGESSNKTRFPIDIPTTSSEASLANSISASPTDTHPPLPSTSQVGLDESQPSSYASARSSLRGPNRELVWPATQDASPLPPGARPHRKNTERHDVPDQVDDSVEEEEAFYPQAIRYGFTTKENPTLPYSKDTDLFCDVIQLSNMKEQGEAEPQYNSFAIEAPTWSSLLKFLNLHGDTRIEAHASDIQDEKIGHGESEIGAQFVKSSSGSGENVVRLQIRLLPPQRLSTPSATVAPAANKNKMVKGSSKAAAAEESSDVALPDHLVLPVRFSE